MVALREWGTPILGRTRDVHVRPEWVNFRSQKSEDVCKFVLKNLQTAHNFNTLNLSTGHYFNNSTWQWVVFL